MVAGPLWMAQVDWSAVVHELGLGYPLKFIWEERAQSLTGYPDFWKQFDRKFPELRTTEYLPKYRINPPRKFNWQARSYYENAQ